VEHRRRDQLAAGCPLEAALDPADLGVGVRPASALLDHPLAHHLQRQRAEVAGERLAVRAAQDAQGGVDAVDLAAGPIGAVVGLCMGPVGQRDVVDASMGLCGGALAAAGQPLADDAVVLAPALFRAVRAEVDVLAVECDDRLAAGLCFRYEGF
jgi:hypothetical protein